jgi:hypothetical protein
MTDPAAPAPGGFPPPGQGQNPGSYPAPGQYPPPPPPGSYPPPPSAPGGYLPPMQGDPGQSPPPFGAPPPAAPPPAKKSKVGRIVLIVVGVIAVLCIGGIFAIVKFAGNILGAAYDVGNCLNEMPGSETATTYNGTLVSCDSADAAAKIVQVHDNASLDDADSLCASAPGYVAAVEVPISDTNNRVLCLAEV